MAARRYVPESHPTAADFPAGGDVRLDEDVLSRSGVTDLVVYLGINDILFALDPDPVASVIAAHERIIAAAHAAGLRVIGATLTPGRILDSGRERQRQAVNEWIRTSGAYDDVVDFDRAIADPDAPTQARAAYDFDGIHLNDAGYRALARAVDTSMFQGTGCDVASPSRANPAPRLGWLDDAARNRRA
jgi:lysophospholipase L1-like esterase